MRVIAAFNTFLLVYGALFPIVDPVGNGPFFLAATMPCNAAERQELAFRVARNSLFLLLGSLFLGSPLLGFFGVTLPAVRVAGGLAVSVFGWQLLQSGVPIDEGAGAAGGLGRPVESFYPLTLPLTVGPGAISVAVTVGSERPKLEEGLAHLGLYTAAVVLAIVAISVTIYLCYRFAERTAALLGERGTHVLLRLSAFIMLCIGIQIIASGVHAFLVQ
jgi:multiple antibiotic resistance protein